MNFFQEAFSIEGVDELLCVYWTSLVTSDFLGGIHSGRFAASWTSKPKVELAYPILTNQLSKGRICGQIKAVPLILKAEFQKKYEKSRFNRQGSFRPGAMSHSS